MVTRKLLVAAALLASGCATTPPASTQGKVAQQAASAPAQLTDSQGRKYRVVCHMEKSTGSNIAEKVCRPELEAGEQQELQDQFRNVHSPQTRAGT